MELSSRLFQPAALMAPWRILRSRFGTTSFGSILENTPNPVQCGHAPNGLLKENIRGVSSSTEMPCSGHPCRQYIHFYRVSATGNTREHNHCIGNHTSFVSHHPRHSVVLSQLQGQHHRGTYIQRYSPGSGCIDCRPYIQHGKIGPDKPIQHMDTGGFSTAHLAVGLLSHLDYHCCRSGRILLRTFSTFQK